MPQEREITNNKMTDEELAEEKLRFQTARFVNDWLWDPRKYGQTAFTSGMPWSYAHIQDAAQIALAYAETIRQENERLKEENKKLQSDVEHREEMENGEDY